MKAFRIISMLLALFAATASLSACQSDGMSSSGGSSSSSGGSGSGGY